VESALCAPSVYNSQPWRWRIGVNRVELYADLTRHVAWTDPGRRDLIMSCGAALHHLRVALAAQGLTVNVQRLPDTGNETHLATITAQRASGHDDLDEAAAALFVALGQRRTERRRMSRHPVPTNLITMLTQLAAAEGALLLPVSGDARQRLVNVLYQAAHEQESTPGYAAELQRWANRYAGSGDGMSAASVAAPDPAFDQELPLRRFPRAELPQPPHRVHSNVITADTAALCVLATAHDDRGAWLRAGEALSAVLLSATRLGLATTPLSQGIEVARTRRKIQLDVLGTTQHPQLILRVGWPATGAAELPATNRRPLDRVLIGR
jgi:nitroreductase